jgi:drug/metabolite transporter (DMT)-like permease
VLRGTGPLFTVIRAYLLFAEVFTLTQWAGVAVLLAGIFGLAIHNLRHLNSQRDTLNLALSLAVLTGYSWRSKRPSMPMEFARPPIH